MKIIKLYVRITRITRMTRIELAIEIPYKNRRFPEKSKGKIPLSPSNIDTCALVNLFRNIIYMVRRRKSIFFTHSKQTVY